MDHDYKITKLMTFQDKARLGKSEKVNIENVLSFYL